MDYNEFHKYVYWLGRYIPQNMQREAMNKLQNCEEEYVAYIIDTSNSATWENGLKVIDSIGFPKNKTAIKSLLYLFQDINWITTQVAYKVVKEIYDHTPQAVVTALNSVIRIARRNEDETWLYGLSWLKENLKIPDKEIDNFQDLKYGQYYD